MSSFDLELDVNRLLVFHQRKHDKNMNSNSDHSTNALSLIDHAESEETMPSRGGACHDRDSGVRTNKYERQSL